MNPRHVFWLDVATAVFAAALLCMQLLPQARAAESWDTTDKVLGTTAVALTIADWAQTRYMAKNPCANAGGGTDCTDPYYENGPIAKRFIGEHPSVGKVDRYFVASVATTLLVADWLSPPLRKAYLGFISVVQFGYVAHNYRVDVKMAFR